MDGERRQELNKEGRFSLDHLWNCDFGVLLEGVHHQAVAPDVVNALEDRQSQRNDGKHQHLLPRLC